MRSADAEERRAAAVRALGVEAFQLDLPLPELARDDADDPAGSLAAVRKARRFNRLLLDAIESSSDAFALWNRDDRLIMCNEAFLDLYPAEMGGAAPGIPFDDLLRALVEAGRYVLEEDTEGWIRRRIAAHRNCESGEHRLSDGRWVLARERRTSDGGIVSVRTDITALKRKEEQLRRREEELRRTVLEMDDARALLEEQAASLVGLAEEQHIAREAAEQASRAKSQFLANMSHELRTPLNAIIGFAQIIAQGAADPREAIDVADHATSIVQAGEHLLALINDILDMSKIEAGKYRLRLETADLAHTVRACCRMVGQKADEAGIAISVDLHAPVVLTHCDERAVRQVLINLLSNAVKFTESGDQVVVRSRLDGDRVVLAVEDTGIGIAEENLERIGRPFEQIEDALVRKQPGTGLGLALSRSLVELHGQSFAVASRYGEGTTVSFTLACAEPPPAVPDAG